MHIKNRLAAIIYKADILVLAIFGVVSEFCQHGWWALRLLAVVAGILCIIYYIATFAVALRDKERPLARVICPTLKGIITISLALSGIMATAFGADLDLIDGMAVLGLILPLLMILDWLLFDEKGTLRMTAPFYFLTLPIIYFSFVIVTSGQISTSVDLRYPYSFLNFKKGEIGNTLVAIGINLIIVFTFGYAYTLADKLLSGEERVRKKSAPVEELAAKQTEVNEPETKITAPERILPETTEIISERTENPETEETDEEQDEENDWDNDSYVIGEPTLADSESEVKMLSEERVSAKAQEQQRLTQAKNDKPASAKISTKPSKQMDIIVPKKLEQPAKRGKSRREPTQRSQENHKHQSARPEARVSNLNRNGRARRNNRRSPKFEDIVRVEAHKTGNNTSKKRPKSK